jgi:hypothetical protein
MYYKATPNTALIYHGNLTLEITAVIYHCNLPWYFYNIGPWGQRYKTIFV